MPTYDSSITGDPHAAAIEAGIQAAIVQVQSHITTPITVNITFFNVPDGLGGSGQGYNTLAYKKYLTDLGRAQALSVNDRRALDTLPVVRRNPVNGDANLLLTNAAMRAIGESADFSSDADIFLNTSLMNLSRSGLQDPNKYDLISVSLHEICEVLGAGGGGSGLAFGEVHGLDLMRYAGNKMRSYTTNPNAKAYFSIDGGKTNLSYFLQSGQGDYGDWDPNLNGFRQVQDGTGIPGETPGDLHLDIDTNEWIAIDVVGYNLNAATFISDLVAAVNALPTSPAVRSDLTQKLNAANAAVAANKPQLALVALRAFDFSVQWYRSTRQLTSAQARTLLAASANIESIVDAR